MKIKTIFIILLVSILLIIAGCTKTECKTSQDCKTKPYYSVDCMQKKCVYEVQPEYKCGTQQEQPCAGKLTGASYLEKYCSEDQTKCISGIDPKKTKPTTISTEQSAGGDRFKITTDFNQPFNTRKDKFNLKVTLQEQAQINSEEKITRTELIGTTKDRRTITLAEKQVNRYLWAEGSEINLPLTIVMPTTEFEGEITNLVLKLYYTYLQTSGITKQLRENIIQNNYPNTKLQWAQPEKPYPCPECSEEGEGMQGKCNNATGFCEYTPILNKCGNYICEPNENKCNCKNDCGPCEVDTGVYTTRQCTTDNKCIAVPKQGIAISEKNTLDDQQRGAFHLQNNYKYKTPFNAKTDKITVEINLYELQPEVTNVKIETIRLLEGTQQLSEVDMNKDLTTIGSVITADLSIPTQPIPESDKSITIAIWYQYTQKNLVQKGKIERQLDKITVLSPE